MQNITIHPTILRNIRLTTPALESLLRDKNPITVDETPDGPRYTLSIISPPGGLVISFISGGAEVAIRTEDEPPYPRECPAAWYIIGDFVPCPRRGCGRGLVWYEAGYVPGYRICLAGHHAQLSDDGRTARDMRRNGIV